MKWEYRIEEFNVWNAHTHSYRVKMVDVMNKLGAEGWELVSVPIQYDSDEGCLIFKRPVGTSPGS